MKAKKHNIYVDNMSRLVLGSNKLTRYLNILFYILIPAFILGGPVIYVLAVKGTELHNNLLAILLLVIFSTLIIGVIIYNVRRTLTKYRTYIIIRRENNVYINNILFCSHKDLNEVVIQEFVDGDGASSFNIGLTCKNGYFPLKFDQGRNEARQIAGILASYLGKEIVEKQGEMIVP